jgi:hypothetical protein
MFSFVDLRLREILAAYFELSHRLPKTVSPVFFVRRVLNELKTRNKIQHFINDLNVLGAIRVKSFKTLGNPYQSTKIDARRQKRQDCSIRGPIYYGCEYLL